MAIEIGIQRWAWWSHPCLTQSDVYYSKYSILLHLYKTAILLTFMLFLQVTIWLHHCFLQISGWYFPSLIKKFDTRFIVPRYIPSSNIMLSDFNIPREDFRNYPALTALTFLEFLQHCPRSGMHYRDRTPDLTPLRTVSLLTSFNSNPSHPLTPSPAVSLTLLFLQHWLFDFITFLEVRSLILSLLALFRLHCHS